MLRKRPELLHGRAQALSIDRLIAVKMKLVESSRDDVGDKALLCPLRPGAEHESVPGEEGSAVAIQNPLGPDELGRIRILGRPLVVALKCLRQTERNAETEGWIG